jgi:phosphoribosylformimino-5-aminoimidazole carboxamide ribotide isomerase
MKLFPAIDIQGGKAVRLRHGDFEQATVFSDDPVAIALQWQEQGAEALHVVDLDAARTGELVNFAIVDDIVKTVAIPVQYGGGVRSRKSLALVAGTRIHWTVMGTAAVTGGALLQDAIDWLGGRLVISVDCADGMVSTHGWQERTQMSAQHFVHELEDLGVGRIVYTDVARDGIMEGPNMHELSSLIETTRLDVVLSGGISSLWDLERLTKIEAPNLVGVIVGRALYEKVFTLEQAKALLG